MLQPLIENAIKHAIAQAELGGTIRVVGYARAGRLHLIIEDSGPDQAGENHSKATGSSVGLKNVKERVEALYGEAGEVALGQSELGGFQIRISFPVNFDNLSDIRESDDSSPNC